VYSSLPPPPYAPQKRTEREGMEGEINEYERKLMNMKEIK
jgi:hypothetical protein